MLVRLVLSILGLGLALLAVWWALERRPARQAERLAERLARAVAERDAAACMAEVHPAYDIAAQWPQHDLGGDPAGMRQQAQLYLFSFFRNHVDGDLRLAAAIREVQALPDARWQARLDLALTADGRPLRPPLTGLRVELARTSWFWGTLRLRAHDPIPW